jgi:hypothetical protein
LSQSIISLKANPTAVATPKKAYEILMFADPPVLEFLGFVELELQRPLVLVTADDGR